MVGCQSTNEKNTGDSTCLSVMGWTGLHSHRPTQYATPANIATWNSLSRYTGGHQARPRVSVTVLMTAVRHPFCLPLSLSAALALLLCHALTISASALTTGAVYAGALPWALLTNGARTLQTELSNREGHEALRIRG